MLSLDCGRLLGSVLFVKLPVITWLLLFAIVDQFYLIRLVIVEFSEQSTSVCMQEPRAHTHERDREEKKHVISGTKVQAMSTTKSTRLHVARRARQCGGRNEKSIRFRIQLNRLTVKFRRHQQFQRNQRKLMEQQRIINSNILYW